MFTLITKGNLTADATAKTFQDGNSVINLTLAVNRRNKDGQETATFLNCSWNVKSTKVLPYLTKGKPVLVQIGWYQNKESDGKYYQTFFINRLELIGGNPNTEQPSKPQGVKSSNTSSEVSHQSVKDDDLPF